MGDRLYIYYTGFAGDKNKAKDKLRPQAYGSLRKRRDGRRAFEARRLCLPKFRKRKCGRKLPRPLVFSGKYLFANADAPNGGTETKLRDAAGKPIETSTFENCEGVSRGLDRCEDEMAQLRRLRTDENPPIFRRT